MSFVDGFEAKVAKMAEDAERRLAAEEQRAALVAERGSQAVLSDQALKSRRSRAKPEVHETKKGAELARQRALRSLRQAHEDEYAVLLHEERTKAGLAPMKPRPYRSPPKNGLAGGPVSASTRPSGVVAPETAIDAAGGDLGGNAAISAPRPQTAPPVDAPAVVKHPHPPHLQAKCAHGAYPLAKLEYGTFCSHCGKRIR